MKNMKILWLVITCISFLSAVQNMDFEEIFTLDEAKSIINVFSDGNNKLFTLDSDYLLKAYAYSDSLLTCLDSLMLGRAIFKMNFLGDKIFVGVGAEISGVNIVKVYDFSTGQFIFENQIDNSNKANTFALLGQDTIVFAKGEAVIKDPLDPYAYQTEKIWTMYFFQYSSSGFDSLFVKEYRDFADLTSGADICSDGSSRVFMIDEGNGFKIYNTQENQIDFQAASSNESKIYYGPLDRVYMIGTNGSLYYYNDDTEQNRGYLVSVSVISGLNKVTGFSFTSDDKIAVADGINGLKLYEWDGQAYQMTAHENIRGNAVNCVNIDSMVFVARGSYGLSAYKMIEAQTTEIIINDFPCEYVLKQNYPNPFNPKTTIDFEIPEKSDITFKIMNVIGKKVIEWKYQNLSVGAYSMLWDGHDLNNNKVPSGIYIYTLVAGDHVESKKMVLLK